MEMIDLLYLLVITGMISCEEKAVRLVVRVGADVFLPCSLGQEVDIQPAVFDWMKDGRDVFLYNAGFYHIEHQQFKGRVSHFPDELKNGNASIIIRNIQTADSGNYSCFFPKLQQQRFNVELFVGSSPHPRVMILNMTEHHSLLQCEIPGVVVKPQISWVDSDGMVLPAEEKLQDSDDLHQHEALMLQTNVTKSGIFRCRVVQQELNHVAEAQIYVQISSDKTGTGCTGERLILVLVTGILILIILFAALIFVMHRRRVMIEKPHGRLKAERYAMET